MHINTFIPCRLSESVQSGGTTRRRHAVVLIWDRRCRRWANFKAAPDKRNLFVGNKKRLPNVVIMVVHCLQRWPIITVTWMNASFSLGYTRNRPLFLDVTIIFVYFQIMT